MDPGVVLGGVVVLVAILLAARPTRDFIVKWIVDNGNPFTFH